MASLEEWDKLPWDLDASTDDLFSGLDQPSGGGGQPASQQHQMSQKLQVAEELHQQGHLNVEEKTRFKHKVLQQDAEFNQDFNTFFNAPANERKSSFANLKKALSQERNPGVRLSSTSSSGMELNLSESDVMLDEFSDFLSLDALADDHPFLAGVPAHQRRSSVQKPQAPRPVAPAGGSAHPQQPPAPQQLSYQHQQHRQQQPALHQRHHPQHHHSRHQVPSMASHGPLPWQAAGPPTVPLPGAGQYRGHGTGPMQVPMSSVRKGSVPSKRSAGVGSVVGGRGNSGGRKSSGKGTGASPATVSASTRRPTSATRGIKTEKHAPALLDDDDDPSLDSFSVKEKKNERERRRRLQVSHGFTNLFQVLKMPDSAKMEKSTVLNNAINRLKELDLTHRTLYEENQRLRARAAERGFKV
ncbi:BHLH domain-containing protein [Durusdinium trenchii]|uniref:BHLH domain-containing protein n=1 Tax=Durusdinium trenchii TaxID=1381693 RepID=A0ABP0JE60_9DINO